jgi:hypothetical protein
LGGLIIKAALVDAREGSDNDRAIRNSSAGLFFFGVPHKGLKNEKILSLIKGQPNSQLVQNLEENSHYLKLAYNSFLRDELDDCPITSFYETQLSPTVKVRLDAMHNALRANIWTYRKSKGNG